MEFKEELKKLKKSDLYKDIDENAYLTHVSMMEEDKSKSGWEFGFYNPLTKKVSVIESNPLKLREPDDILNRDGDVEELDLDKVKISVDQLNELVDKVAKKENVSLITKKILILQKIKKTIWNITYLTKDYNLLNVRIDAENGALLHSEFHSVFDLGLRQ